MTDSITTGTNSFFADSNHEDEEQTSFEPQGGTGAMLRTHEVGQTSAHLNLRDALEWLLGTAPHGDDDELSHEERAARKTRRMDLLLWLLNLEPRLAPYGE